MVGEAVLIDGLTHPAERLGRGYLPALNVPRKRRIFSELGEARIFSEVASHELTSRQPRHVAPKNRRGDPPAAGT